MQNKRDVDVSFRHMFCIHHKALQTMHRVNDAGHCGLYLFYFLALPFFYPFYVITVLFYSNHYDLQEKVLSPGLPPGFFIKCPSIAAGHCLHEPIFPLFLLHGQFHEHDGHMPPFQSVSNDQQSSFRLYQPICLLNH